MVKPQHKLFIIQNCINQCEYNPQILKTICNGSNMKAPGKVTPDWMYEFNHMTLPDPHEALLYHEIAKQ